MIIMKNKYFITYILCFIIVTFVCLANVYPMLFSMFLFLASIITIPFFLLVLSIFNDIKTITDESKTRYIITFKREDDRVITFDTDTKPQNFLSTEKSLGRTIILLNVYKYQN